MKATRYIVIELLDYTTDEEAQDFANEINARFQPHYDAHVSTSAQLVEAEAEGKR